MFDRDKTGTIGIHEFQHLYNYINQWLAVFRSYDKDNSSFIDEKELSLGKSPFIQYLTTSWQPWESPVPLRFLRFIKVSEKLLKYRNFRN